MTSSQPLPVPAARSSFAGDLVVAAVIGGAAYALSCLLVQATDAPHGFGNDWQAMSAAPLELRGLLPHRLLSPMLAWLCGCGGEGWVPFTRGLAVLLLMTVALFARRRGAELVDAALVTVAIAVTAATQLYKEHWVGYVDPLSYTLFFWALLVARHPAPFWALWFCNLLNHEMAAFALPWLWFVRRRAGGKWQHDLIGAGLALGTYAAFYLWVQANAPKQLFDAEYFASHPLFPGGTFVVWCLALLHLVVAYGPVLAVLAWQQHRRAQDGERWHLWLVALASATIFCIAWDWARHSNVVVLPLVLASLAFLRAGHRLMYAGLIALGVGLMMWVRPWSADAWPTSAIANNPLLVGSGVAVVHKPRFDGDFNVTFGPLSVALQNWLPVAWQVLAVAYAIGAVIWLAGALFARREARG